MDEVGGFDRMASLILPIARRRRVACSFYGDPDPASGTGRTWYFGSKTSDVRVCMYEKGLKAIQDGYAHTSPNWLRVELRVRPRKDRKALVAKMPVTALWGLSQWSQEVSGGPLASAVPFVPDAALRRHEGDKAFAHMLRQYSGVMRGYRERHGAREVFEQIKSVLRAD